MHPAPGLTLSIALILGGVAKAEPPADVDFNRAIRPLLSARCLPCHGRDDDARQARLRLDRFDDAVAPRRRGGSAIVPGDADGSLVLERVISTDSEERMPPPDQGPALTSTEIDLVRRWIDAGAQYDEHWAFTAPSRPEPPPVRRQGWTRNPIDRFVLARLEREGLAPSPEADRHTLIRRLSLDLTGLPPTPERVRGFVEDDEPQAYERLVDRLLASPHYGERWARVWLDLARYADTKGYEADRRRTMWPYRDWVIDAYNRDVPFDRFTIEQLAGDLLPDAGSDQLVATAFHRNTMTNDEGGTDDEEFRAAAVVDRVDTTMQVWMGLTMACARCHTHKYDPFSHREYFQLYAFFNQTADVDAMDERPLLEIVTEQQTEELRAIDAERTTLERRIRELPAEDDGETTAPQDEPRDVVWIDDDLPPGAKPVASGGEAEWTWVATDEHPVAAGRRAVTRTATDGVAQHFFTDAFWPLPVHDGDALFAHVYLDPANPPRQIMLQWHDGSSWEHRAYWGESLITWGADGTASRLGRGPLPKPGAWVRLEIDAASVGLADGAVIDGWAFSQHGGTVLWDAAGIRSRRPKGAADLPAEHRAALAPLVTERRALDERAAAVRDATPRLPIMRELDPEQRRVTNVHRRGSFLDPGEEVTPDVPAIFPSLDAPPNRLGLARWLVSRDNPLTARVAVNRTWAQLFGTGLVETSEDFGTQGALPSHPELLDWLAVEFMDDGWSGKMLLRLIVNSATYRQTSRVTPELARVDPANRLLARGPRFRLEAEMIRDQALAVAGLLERRLHGPPVFPPQPDGIWQVVYSDDRWVPSAGDDRHRRALYTFWRRTSPYPAMLAFDAPSREYCVPRRIRTNTPLQALVTLNDPAFVEAAQHLGRRMIATSGDDPAAKIDFGIRASLARPATPGEIETLAALYASEHAHFANDPSAATALAGSADDAIGGRTDDAGEDDAVSLAAWTVVANVILNLDELLTKE